MGFTMSDDFDWELVIIGGGPAGMTSAIYGARYGLRTLLLDEMVLGGAQATSPAIENYPGFTFIPGMELAERMKEQVKRNGATIKEITGVENIEIDMSGEFNLKTRRGVYHAKAIIIATGGGHRKLGVQGEEDLTGRGISYCATCDAPLYRNKEVAVVGGGNTAVTEALYLKDVTNKVYLIHRRDQLRAEQALQNLLFKSNVEIKWSHVVKEFKNVNNRIEGILENVKTGEKSTLVVDAYFIALGSDPKSDLAKAIGVKTNEKGEILIDQHQATNIEGVYAAGDVTASLKQISVAVGQGAIAANSAYEYIRQKKAGSY